MSVVTQPGALNASGLRRVVWVLSVTEITSWGVLYYAFAVLASGIATDTGWSLTAVTGAFSVSLMVSGLVGIVIGQQLDRHGPRCIMTVGSVLGSVAVLVIAAAPNYGVFAAGWVLAGVAMSGTLYPPAFAALTRWGGAQRVKALTSLTLVAGLASTVFAPLAAVLEGWTDWRETYLVLGVVLAVVTVPLHWWGLEHAWEPVARSTHQDGSHAPEVQVVPFAALMLTATVAAFVVYAAVVMLVPMLVERGLSTTEAAVGLGIGGVGQVAGRLGYARFVAATTPVSRLALTIVAVSATTLLAAMTPAIVVVLFGVSALMGVSRGIFTLIQATAVSDRWGTARFGHLNGLLSAPVLLASAVAPFAGTALAHVLGGQREAFIALGAIAALSAVPALATGTTMKGSL